MSFLTESNGFCRSVTPILAAILPAVAVRLLDQPLGVERSVVTAACDQLAQLEHAVGRQAIRASLQVFFLGGGEISELNFIVLMSFISSLIIFFCFCLGFDYLGFIA